MMMITTLLWWFISPRLHEISTFLALSVLSTLRVFYSIIVVGILLVLLTSYLEKNFLIARTAVRLSIIFVFPATIILGRMIGIPKDKIRESFVHVNNTFVKVLTKKYQPHEILILLPHCLQNTDCLIRVTIDINNCQDCGRCKITNLKKIARETGVHIAIATGGSLARRIIIKHRPKFIIAVACERDLVDGLLDVFPIPVYGVLNERPFGPCVNTSVAIEAIETALKSLCLVKDGEASPLGVKQAFINHGDTENTEKRL
ncbi:MAG: DUF116 domain-containing protein [Candidatus Cloacimonetes bacterium]|nr:DUF116 domain-containing protein [Candidatus Cloacimonadota bacterium]